MKSVYLSLSICMLGMLHTVSAQDFGGDLNFGGDLGGGGGGSDLDLGGAINESLSETQPNDMVKVDTINYLSDQVQNYFFGANVGVSLSMGENTRFGNFLDMSKLSFQLTAGKFFYPQFGLRVSLQYLNQKGRSEWEIAKYEDKYGAYDGNYDFSMGCIFVDGLINFHNVFWKYKEDRKFNLIGYLGLGGFITFGFDQDKLDYLEFPYYKTVKVNGVQRNYGDPMSWDTFSYPVNGNSHGYFAGHVGLIANYMITDAWDINLDVSFNGTDDAYNGVRFRRVYDSYVNIMAGVMYHLPDPTGKHRLKYSQYTDQDVVTLLNRELMESGDSLKEAMKPKIRMEENVAYNEMLQTVVSFYIDKTFVTDAQKRNVRSVALFMENHPDIDVVVTGYADVQTAYPKYNMMLSQKRAQAVYDILTKEYNVDPNRLSMDYKGDEEQPFQIVNEWNRAVVFIIKPHDNSFVPTVQDKANGTPLNRHEVGRLRQTDSRDTRTPYETR